MSVQTDDDVGDYALFRTRYNFKTGLVTNGVSNVIWFPDEDVKAGDTVVVYTKTGSRSFRANEDGSKSYFFYWNLPAAIWEGDRHAPVLLHIDRWTHLNPTSSRLSEPRDPRRCLRLRDTVLSVRREIRSRKRTTPRSSTQSNGRMPRLWKSRDCKVRRNPHLALGASERPPLRSVVGE